MARRMSSLKQFAIVGARQRLHELQAEMLDVVRQFPALKNERITFGRRRRANGATGTRKRKPLSPAQRKAIGERVRKMWAEKRKAKAAKAKGKE